MAHRIGPCALVRRVHCVRPCARLNALLRPPQRRAAFRLQRTSLARVGTCPRVATEAVPRRPRAAPPSLPEADQSAAPFSFFLCLTRTRWPRRAWRRPPKRGRRPATTSVALGRVARPRRCQWFQISRLSDQSCAHCTRAFRRRRGHGQVGGTWRRPATPTRLFRDGPLSIDAPAPLPGLFLPFWRLSVVAAAGLNRQRGTPRRHRGQWRDAGAGLSGAAPTRGAAPCRPLRAATAGVWLGPAATAARGGEHPRRAAAVV